VRIRGAIAVGVLVLLAVPSGAQAGWSRTHTLSSTDLAEPAPRVAVGPQGHVVVAWLRKGGDLRVAIGDSHGRFAGSRRLSRHGLRPRVAVGRRGRAIAVWNEEGGLRFALRAPGAARFGPARELTAPGEQSTDDAALVAMDGNGRALVVYEHSFRSSGTTTSHVVALEVAADGTIGQPEDFGLGRLPRRGTLSVLPDGRAVFVFVPTQPGFQVPTGRERASVVVAYRSALGRWTSEAIFDDAGEALADPNVGLDATGRVTLTFTEQQRGGEATSFGPPRIAEGPFGGPLHAPAGPVLSAPDKAFEPWGLPASDADVLVWQEKTRSTPFSVEAPIRAARVTFDGKVGKPRTLDPSQKAVEPHVARLRPNRVLIVWGHPAIRAAVYRASRGFASISAPRGEATYGGTDFNVNRDLAANDRGVAAFVWTEGKRVRISVARF
jgi:hypothetical protein